MSTNPGQISLLQPTIPSKRDTTKDGLPKCSSGFRIALANTWPMFFRFISLVHEQFHTMPKRLQWTIGMLCGFGLFAIQIFGFCKTRQCSDWPSAAGRVVSSEYKRTGKTHSSIVKYEYYLAGKKYASNNIRFAGFSVGRSTLDRYPRGKVVRVFYNPANPEDVVLERDFPLTAYLAMVGGIVIFVIFAMPLLPKDEREKSAPHFETEAGHFVLE